MSKEVISRNEIARYCYLSEALYYLVLGILPKAYLFGNNKEDVRTYCFNAEELTEFEEIRSLRKPFYEFKEIVTKALTGKKLKENPYLAEDFRSMEKYVAEYINGTERNKEKFLKAKSKELNIEDPRLTPSYKVTLSESNKTYRTPEGDSEPREKNSHSKLPYSMDEVFGNSSMKFVTLQESLFGHMVDLINEIEEYEESLEVICESGLRRLKQMVINGKIKIYKKESTQAIEMVYKANFIPVSEVEAISLISESYKYWNENVCNFIIDFEDILTEYPISGEKVHYKLLDLNHQTILDSNISEKVKSGGKSSYSNYKPLKAKVEEFCKIELAKKKSLSALQLCNIVGNIIETEHQNLLKNFHPYQKYLKGDGTDWLKPTIYGWCNEVYKVCKGLK